MTDGSKNTDPPKAPIKVKKTSEPPLKVKRTHPSPKKPERIGRTPEKKVLKAGKERYREMVKAESGRLLQEDPKMNPKRSLFMLLGGFLVIAFATALILARRSPTPDVLIISRKLREAGVPYVVSNVHIGDIPFKFYAVRTTDLSPLQDLPIQALILLTRQVSDLGPLRGMTNLRCLVINDTEVSDLGPLKGLPLHFLDLRGTPVHDLKPLDGMPLENIGFTEDTATNGVAVLRRMPTLKLINKRPPEKFWPAYDAARRPPGKSWRDVLQELDETPEADETHAPDEAAEADEADKSD